MAEQDMFGHVVNLNFDKRGDSHTTACGGFVSTCVRIFLILYVYLLVEKLVNKGNDTDFSFHGIIELHNLGKVDYKKDMDVMIFHVLSKQDKTSTPQIDSLSSFEKYFEISYISNHNDFNTGHKDKKRYPVKICTEEDFGTSE